MKIKNTKSGFTLLETIIAIAVISLVITATAQLTQSSISIGGKSMRQFIANHLAEEGLEVVRNMRDSNWLQNQEWKKGLADGVYTIQENFGNENGKWSLSRVLTADSVPELALNENEKFERTIEISSLGKGGENLSIRVKSIVKYQDGNKAKELFLTADLTNWKKGPL
ncbi:MAG: type II secretion system protein [Patescibacteria group bacterium]